MTNSLKNVLQTVGSHLSDNLISTTENITNE